MNLFNPKKYVKLQLWGLDGNAFSCLERLEVKLEKKNGRKKILVKS